ncbi:hypothetical protein K8B83_20105 [Shewanella inventionis]|uniref:Uncharacterized protein n=1 Tax=Shewanella inventionis TaxID=1738770 RepID=A0ABQ1J1G6_9GAMM|nr:hypothetical protein [Shewanella inventionis]MCL1160204.1 hypothetical protein [Shewanella inventionis]UAL43072.1 hypothetical protein K8B83_20105 [Shewanella inventionis]GGB57276.1 hypothetical protein GCM10011607_17320 [Shewanella inventionis]
MISKVFYLIFLAILLNAANADVISIPIFSGESTKYTDPYGGELILGERTPEQLKFWFRTIGGNYHQCHMTGIATSRNNETYIYSRVEQINEKNVFCSLSVIVLDNSVVLIDEGNHCKAINCGQRAGINGAVFHRAK